MCGIECPHTALGNLFQLMSTLNAHVVLLGISDLSVSRGKHRIKGSIRQRVGELGGRLFLIYFFKVEFY